MQSEEDQRAHDLQSQVSELEAMVSAACARGVEPARCRDVIEGAVKRARWKGALLPHLDSQLLLSTLEQAKGEIAGLADVTQVNAEVMQEELLHHTERAEEHAAAEGTSEEAAAASVVSVPGSSSVLEPLGSPVHTPHARASPFGSAFAATAGGSSGELSAHGSARMAPRTPGQPPLLSVADAVAPMRDFASEVAAEGAVEAEAEKTFRHALSMRRSSSGELRMAAAYDFGTAVSPRAGYHVRDTYFSRPSASSARSTDEEREEGEAEQEGEADAEQEGGGLLMYSRVCVSRVTEEEDEEGEEKGEEPGVTELRPATGGRGIEVAARGEVASAVPPRMRRGQAGSAPGLPRSPGGSTSCWAGVPPGLNPLAAVEGSGGYEGEALPHYDSIDPQSPTGVGEVDLLSYSSAPFSLHTVTPPRHVMAELAASVASRLRM